MKKSTNMACDRRPRAIGTGLVALDVVLNVHSKDSPRCYAGGSCGNVLTVLRYLGWNSSPVSRLAPGLAADQLLADLRGWKVSTQFVTVEDKGSTPVIFQQISRSATGEPRHSFSWRCPVCGAYFPGYKPLLATAAEELMDRLPVADVFFFDRVSRGAIQLAKASSERGATVVFEPSGVGDPKLFREAWSLADIVKYSHERLRDIADLDLKRSDREGVLLEIETLGADGLRYRSRLPNYRTRGWRQTRALEPLDFKDAAGAGDWCTAGILDRLARGGVAGLRTANEEKVRDALRYGQALAAWNCGFEGARGGMYQVDKRTFECQVQRILTGSDAQPAAVDVRDAGVAEFLDGLCPTCKKPAFATSRPPRLIRVSG